MDDNFDQVRTVHHHNAEGHQGVAVYNQLRVVFCLGTNSVFPHDYNV